MNEFESLIYECRLLCFMETEPQSNKYNQVMLDENQFKIISENIGKLSENQSNLKEGFEMRVNRLSEEEYTLPDLQSIN